MKNLMKAALAAVAVAALSACGGGGGGNTSTGGTYFTHAQLAQEFVRRVNVDVAGYDLTLVKTDTLKYDYIVVYDNDYRTYDAYYIGAYNPGENLVSYLNKYESYTYYDLIPESGNTYLDYVTGTRFEKGVSSEKNLSAMKALGQQLAITKAAEGMQATYGMSQEKAMSLASFAYKVKTSVAGTYSIKDYDAFSKDLTGSSISEFQADVKSGDLSSLQSRIELAGETTGMGSEGAQKVIADIFMK